MTTYDIFMFQSNIGRLTRLDVRIFQLIYSPNEISDFIRARLNTILALEWASEQRAGGKNLINLQVKRKHYVGCLY